MSSSSLTALTIWLIASIFYAYQYVLRVMPNVMIDDIMQQFGIGTSAFGQFSGVYYIGYSLMHLPLGICLDRYGPKKIMTGCILLTVVGLTPLLFAEHWIYPIIGRLVIGMGSSAAILGLFKIIRMTFSEQKFPRMLSLSITVGLLGAIYGGAPVSYMRDTFGYQSVVQLFAVAGILLAGITYRIIPDQKEVRADSVKADLQKVFRCRRVIWTCLFAGLMVGPLEGFADVWGTAFLKQVYGLDAGLAAGLPSMIFIGMCFGAPVLSLIADKVGSYIGTIIAAGFGMIAGFCFLLSGRLSSGDITIGFVIIGICSAYQILAIYKASSYVDASVAGLTTALANMIIMIFGYAFHTTIGYVINFFGGAHADRALIYGVAVIPIGLLLGTSGFIFLALTDKKFQEPIVAS